MGNANNSLTLSTTDQIIFDATKASNPDTPCRTIVFINRDTSIWALVNIRGLHNPGEYAAIPPNSVPIPLGFAAGPAIEQVSVKAESGSPILAWFVAVR